MCDNLENDTQKSKTDSYEPIVACWRCGYTVMKGDQCGNCGRGN